MLQLFHRCSAASSYAGSKHVRDREPSGSGKAAGRLVRVVSATAVMAASIGCVSLSVRVHPVPKTVIAGNLMDATLDQLVQRLNTQDAAIQSMSATVTITASTGGQHEGEVKEIPTFAGYILLRRPNDLRVLLLLPVLRSRALDMVTDGKTFQLLIPPKNRAITGTDSEVATSSGDRAAAASVAGASTGSPAHNIGLESLRPYIIRDALLIPPPAAGEFLGRTESSRTLPPTRNRKESVEEPDYDITILRRAAMPAGATSANGVDQVLDRVRVIHIGRADLEPYQQDIYDTRGRIVTTVQYSKYQRFGDVNYPTSILITRPLDEYSLRIDITKLQINPKLDDEQFVLKIPENVPVQKM
jgi:hypothetical protein